MNLDLKNKNAIVCGSTQGSVKNNLQNFLNNDGIESTKNYNILKKQLLKFVQKEK